MTADDLKRYENALIYGTSHPEAYMTKADELWGKYSYLDSDGDRVAGSYSFYEALKEYGEYVRSEAVKVCQNKGAQGDPAKHYACHDCATAIEKLEIK